MAFARRLSESTLCQGRGSQEPCSVNYVNLKRDIKAETEDDNGLMLAYAAGQAKAFDALYARYRLPLYQFVLHGCSDPERAAELFQDVWTSVINSRESFRDTGTFKSWLYRIARNRLIDHYRRSPNNFTDAFDETSVQNSVTTLEAPLSPMELNELNENRELVQHAIHTLPWEQREAVILKYVAGFTLAEIASEQNEAQETVKSRLRYAYTKLRQQLRVQS